MRRGRTTRPPRPVQWVWFAGDMVLVVLAVMWLLTGALWAIVAWEAVGVVYLVGRFASVWRGQSEVSGSAAAARAMTRISWITPLLASLVGVSAAVAALVARSAAGADTTAQIGLAAAASVGVVLSWALLQVGFAEAYQALDESDPDVDAIEFPGRHTAAFLNYLYFSFTVGTAFATSDARVTTLPVRRIVLIQSIVSFFYNALVVATAIQVLQQLVAG